MSEFQEVMRQWGRRCEHCDAKENVHCYVHGDTCEAFRTMKDCTNFKLVEEDIMKWAADHPEPVYPTWRDWIETQYHQTRKAVDCGHESLNSWMNNTPIPADIAQRLGLQPKEGT